MFGLGHRSRDFASSGSWGPGAMGTVYLARDAATDRRVALKVLAPELARDERFRRRFLRESAVAAALRHPNVVRTLAAGDEDGLLYLAMEYVDGVDLRELLRDDGRLAPERAVRLVSEVAGALDAAHDKGLVHRDVKPGNVLVSRVEEPERAYVCDFGLARHVSSVWSLTGDRGFVGTIDYVPPEQIEGGSIDRRADVYSLGCVLFECLTGERPFPRESELSVVFAHLNEPPPRVSELCPELPEAFDGVVATALAKSPDDRYSSCGELAAAARAALDGRPVRAASAAAAPDRARGRDGDRRWCCGPGRSARGSARRRQHRQSGAASRADRERGQRRRAGDRRVRERVPLGEAIRFGVEPDDLVFAGGSAWVLLRGEQRLVRVDPATRRVAKSVSLPWSPGGRLAAGAGKVWATEDGGPGVAGVDARTGTIARRFDVPGENASGIAFGGGSLWVAQGDDVARLDPRSGRILARIHNAGQSSSTVWLVYADGALWSARGRATASCGRSTRSRTASSTPRTSRGT